jgi:hypothetical protein
LLFSTGSRGTFHGIFQINHEADPMTCSRMTRWCALSAVLAALVFGPVDFSSLAFAQEAAATADAATSQT